MENLIVENTPPAAGRGRPKGAPNKTTKAVKDMILAALDEVGGQAYFVEQARTNPVAFMALIGKVLPSEIKAENINTGSVDISVKWLD